MTRKTGDVLLQTRVPKSVAREVRRLAEIGGDSDAGWLRRWLTHEVAQKDLQSGEFLNLEGRFIRKSSIVAMKWVDPHAGSCAAGEKPWELAVHLTNGTVTTLSAEHAAIVLKVFGLPHENPHPNGGKAHE